MEKTIEERMEDLAASNWRSTRGDAASFHHHEDLERGIIADWNAAETFLEDWIGKTYTINETTGKWHCYYCNANTGWRQEMHAPETCMIAALQAVLARMEGGE